MLTILRFVVRFVVLAFITLLILASVSVGVSRDGTVSNNAVPPKNLPVPVSSQGYPLLAPANAQWKRAPGGALPPNAI
ncbi:MAG: hypothetical protein ACT4P0_09630 [Panacagrimonas sp.]